MSQETRQLRSYFIFMSAPRVFPSLQCTPPPWPSHSLSLELIRVHPPSPLIEERGLEGSPRLQKLYWGLKKLLSLAGPTALSGNLGWRGQF